MQKKNTYIAEGFLALGSCDSQLSLAALKKEEFACGGFAAQSNIHLQQPEYLLRFVLFGRYSITL